MKAKDERWFVPMRKVVRIIRADEHNHIIPVGFLLRSIFKPLRERSASS